MSAAARPEATAALTRLAAFVAEAPLAADAATRAIATGGVIDTLGCILAGRGEAVSHTAHAAVAAMGGLAGPAAVLGCRDRATRPAAAFLNAVAGHALDFDDWELSGNTHPTVVILPALLASADTATGGEALLQAYLAGFEVIARLGEALTVDHYDRGWHSTATLGAIGAAAAVARLLGLDAAATAHALAIATSRAAGYTCQFGSDAKPFQAGFAAETGVTAAHLARAGGTGQVHVLDHPRGFATLTTSPGAGPGADIDPDRLTAALDRLGAPLALTQHGLVLKPWPGCGYTHRIMTAAISLTGRITGDVAAVDLALPDVHAAVMPFRQPADRCEALFSLPFVTAMGLTTGDLGLADLDAAAWTRPDIRRLIDRTRVTVAPAVDPTLAYNPAQPDRIAVTLAGGDRLQACCAFPLGAPQNPMDPARILEKFRRNAPAVPDSLIDRLATWPAAPAVLPLVIALGAA